MEVVLIKNIGFPVPDDIYMRLKMLCLKKDVTLKQFMLDLIIKVLEEQEQQEK